MARTISVQTHDDCFGVEAALAIVIAVTIMSGRSRENDDRRVNDVEVSVAPHNSSRALEACSSSDDLDFSSWRKIEQGPLAPAIPCLANNA